MSTRTQDIEAILKLEQLSIINAKLATLFSQEVDIHSHTQEIGQHYLPFCQIDREYQLSSFTKNIEVVIQEILSMCPNSKKTNISKVLATIKNSPTPDGETHIPLQELLIRTWSLTRQPNMYSNCVDLILDNLDHNIVTAGGCVPGIAARLVQPYTNFVLFLLRNRISQLQSDRELENAIAASLITVQEQLTSHIAAPGIDENDDELQLALTLSRSMQDNQNREHVPTVVRDEEEDELQLVLALSKSMMG